jgi:hypothetical protein
MNYLYKGVDLRTASQYDLSEKLHLSPVLISFENEVSKDEERVFGLYAFAENHNLDDLLTLLETLFP